MKIGRHKIMNGNGVKIVNFATSKNPTGTSTMFHHHNIHKFTWTSDEKHTFRLTIF
jgi:hypothetical protein